MLNTAPKIIGLSASILAVALFYSPAFAQTPTPTPILQGKFDPTMSNDVLAGATGVYQDVLGDVHISGNVGVGTTNPLYKLEVAGNGTLIEAADGFNSPDDYATIYLGDPYKYLQANWGGLTTLLSNDPILIKTTNGGNQLYLSPTSGYNVGIGTTSPGVKLDINGATRIMGGSGFYLQNASANANTVLSNSGTGGATDFRVDTGISGAFYVANSGNVGIGTTNPGFKLDVSGDANATRLCIAGNCKAAWPTANAGSGTIDYVAKFITSSTVGNSQIFDNGIQVGIGTTNPSRLLDVNGTIVVAGNASYGFKRTSDKVIFDALVFDNYNKISIGGSNVSRINLDTTYGTQTALSIVGSTGNPGNIGIGTTSPTSKLNIYDASTGPKFIIQGPAPRLDFMEIDGAADNQKWIFEPAAEQFRGRIFNDAESAASDWLQVDRTGTTVDKVVFPNGNVGIGTTSPSYRFHVASNLGYLGYFQNTSATDYRPLGFTDENNAVVGSIGYDTTANVFSLSDSTGRTISLNNGNVGIGTTGPGVKLQISGGTYQPTLGNLQVNSEAGLSYITIGNSDSVNAHAYIAGASALLEFGSVTDANATTSYGRWNSIGLGVGYNDPGTAKLAVNGNVGVGTTAPGAKLQINPPSASEGIRIALPATTPYSPVNIQNSAGTDIFRVNETGTLAVGTVPWARLDSFPAACSAGQYVSAVGSTLTCSTPAGASFVRWDQIQNPALNTGLTLDMTNTQTAFQWTNSVSGGGGTLLQLSDTTVNTNWGYLLNLITSSQSLVQPLHVSAKGKDAILVNSNAAVGIGTTTLPSNAILSVNNRTTSPPAIFVDDTGTVGIGTTDTNANGQKFSVGGAPGTSPGFQVNSYGNIYKINGVSYSWPASQGAAGYQLTNNGSGSLTWGAASDRRLKDNIQGFDDGLATLRQINPVSFEYNGQGGTARGARSIGIVAQEVKNTIPYTISTFKAKLNPNDQTETELYSFNQNPLTFVTINAVKELDTKTVNQEAKIKTLEETVQKQQTKTGQLENDIRLLRQEIESMKYSR